MNKYAGMVGLKFNKLKTGLASIGSATGNKPSGLPNGDIHWGFLKCEPSQSRFVIDQDDVNLHIVELHCQLASTKSVFSWPNILCLLLLYLFYTQHTLLTFFFLFFFYTQHTLFTFLSLFFLCPTYFVYFYFLFF